MRRRCRQALQGYDWDRPRSRQCLGANPESAALNSWLDYNRATLLSKLDGLTEEQAGQRMVGPRWCR